MSPQSGTGVELPFEAGQNNDSGIPAAGEGSQGVDGDGEGKDGSENDGDANRDGPFSARSGDSGSVYSTGELAMPMQTLTRARSRPTMDMHLEVDSQGEMGDLHSSIRTQVQPLGDKDSFNQAGDAENVSKDRR